MLATSRHHLIIISGEHLRTVAGCETSSVAYPSISAAGQSLQAPPKEGGHAYLSSGVGRKQGKLIMEGVGNIGSVTICIIITVSS